MDTNSQKQDQRPGLPTPPRSADRFEELRRLHKRHQLGRHPLVQAEAIANHYTAYARLAMELRKLIELRKHVGPSEDADKAIEMITDEIKAGHAKDLGIELLWQNTKLRCEGTSAPTTKDNQ